MTDLANAHCEAGTPGTPPLPEEEAAALCADVRAWERDGNRTLR